MALTTPAIITIVILLVATVLFVTEWLPYPLVCLLVSLSLYYAKVIDSPWSKLTNSNIILILGMCVIGQAMFDTGIASKLGKMITRFSNNERMLRMGVMLVPGLISAFLSNMAVAVCMLPIVLSICIAADIKPCRLLIPMAIACGLGGSMTLIGSFGNLIARDYMLEWSQGAQTVSFFDYTPIGVLMFVASLAIFWFLGDRMVPNDREPGDMITQIKEKDYSNVPKWQQILSITVFAGVVVLMMLADVLGLTIANIAVWGAVILVALKVVSVKSAFASFQLRTVFVIAFMLPIGTALTQTGAGDWIADKVFNLVGTGSDRLILFSVFLLGCILTQFMSNTAASTLICPIALSIAVGLGINPKALLIASILGTSCGIMTPMAMSVNAAMMEPAGYRFKDWIMPGGVVCLACCILNVIFLPIFFPLH
ncbi:SLC13 family permease [Enterocloster asparagiformis]|uniref:SLC13 family permease n=1 Tax=Enterocloster asparagiformis TaxID=333367 RepID=UPI002A7F0F4A|nr:SLC13 family permease [Enterocloster asparagiformis]